MSDALQERERNMRSLVPTRLVARNSDYWNGVTALAGTPFILYCNMQEGDFWRKQYEDIIPGYYMNKQHWNSVKADGEVPDDILKDMLDKAYQIVLGGFSKKRQKEVLGDE